MRICEGVLLVGLLSFASPAFGQSHEHGPASIYGSADDEVSSLAKNLDNAIKLCTALAGRGVGSPEATKRIEDRSVASGLFKWVDDAPASLKALAERDGSSAKIGSWFDPHATIWIVADDKRPRCRIVVGGSYWTSQVRPALYAVIQDDHYWTARGPEEAVNGSLVRAEFRAEPLPGPNSVQPVISVTAPAKAVEGGVQLTVGVYLQRKEEK